MKSVIDLPVITDQTAFNMQRWNEICSDPFWQQEGRVETDRFGGVIMNPPADYSHGGRQFDIGSLLRSSLPDGRVTVESPISTSEGVKVADVSWISQKRLIKIGGHKVLKAAPEICVEVLSPSNTRNEMAEKRRLYFEAGAKEVWFCDATGKITFFLKQSPAKDAGASAICPKMPREIEG